MAPAPRPFWLAEPSRYALFERGPARIVVALLLLLVIGSFTALISTPPPPAAQAETTRQADDQRDVVLYGSIVESIRHGDGYYAATARALKAGGYPLRPFITFRLPSLAMIQAHLPPIGIALLLEALALATLIAWSFRLRGMLAGWRGAIIGLVLLIGGLLAFVQSSLAPFHEIWAGLLIALSLALRGPGRFVEAAAIGLIAALIRETAGLYLLIMAVLAWRDGDRREAMVWAATIAALGLALAAHALGVSRVVSPLDPASPGWTGLLGFGFFVRSIQASTALTGLPLIVAAPLIALALFGWSVPRDPFARRAGVTLAAYALLLALFARADNFYWALLVAPFSLAGLVFVPDGIRDLARRALDKRRITVTRVTR